MTSRTMAVRTARSPLLRSSLRFLKISIFSSLNRCSACARSDSFALAIASIWRSPLSSSFSLSSLCFASLYSDNANITTKGSSAACSDVFPHFARNDFDAVLTHNISFAVACVSHCVKIIAGLTKMSSVFLKFYVKVVPSPDCGTEIVENKNVFDYYIQRFQ